MSAVPWVFCCKHFRTNSIASRLASNRAKRTVAAPAADGLTVYASLEELEKAGEKHFDLISMSHVLEHLPDPVGYLVHLRETLLDPQGWLLLEVPNLYAHDSFEVAHLVSYSAHTLLQTLEKAGFEVSQDGTAWTTKICLAAALYNAVGTPENRIFPVFQEVRAEKQVSLKRQVGMATPPDIGEVTARTRLVERINDQTCIYQC